MILLFVFTFSLSSCLHQGCVIIHGVIKFGTDHLSEGFPKAIELTIPNISICFHFRDSIQVLNLNFVQFTF